MLTADLVRFRRRKGRLRPQYVDPTDGRLVSRARTVCRAYSDHRGHRRAELDETLRDLVGDETEFLVSRGLAKLMDDRATWETVSPIDCVDLRRRVFEAAAAAHPVGSVRSRLHPVSRADVLASVAAEIGVAPDAVEAGLYADLKSNQVMTDLRTMDGDALLHRYNLALAQGVLLRASTMRVELRSDNPKRLREFFRYVKFRQLMHRTERQGDTWTVTIDGPLSLFHQSQRYGLQMALLLPAIILLEHWRVDADVTWKAGEEPCTFVVSPDDGLATHLRSRGTYVTEEERTLRERVEKRAGPWSMHPCDEIIDLCGQDILVPDLVLAHEDGRRAFVEIVGFWRRGYLERRLETLARHGPDNLVLCVSRRMAAERARLEELGADVVDFAAVIPLGRLLTAAERVAI